MKYNKLTAIVLALTAALSGCSDARERDLEYVDTSELATASTAKISPIVFNESSTNESTDPNENIIFSSSSVNKAADSGSSTHAEINIPTSSDYFTATAEIMEYDPENVKNVFFGNADVTENTLNYPNRSPVYIWENEDKRLYVSNDDAVIEYTSDLSVTINTIFGAPSQGGGGNANLFVHSGDNLDFCTKDEAVKAVSDTLTKLGVSVSEGAKVYSLSQSDMQAVVNAECEKGEFYQFDDEMNRVPVDSYTVSKNQECYYIVFSEDCGGVPIYNDALYYKTIKDLTIFHPTITAIYSADGLAELKVGEYRSINRGEKISQLITPEAAAQVVGEKYKDVVGIEKIAFDKMSLTYVLTPISENGKINLRKTNLTLAWVCTVSMTEYTYDRATGTQASVTSHKDIFIDAQTGVEII